MRLVDADDLEKRLHERALDEWNQRTATTWSDAFLECEDMVYDAPTVDAVPLEDYRSMERTVNKLTKAIADAEPVRHGHWIERTKVHPDLLNDSTYNYECSECGYWDTHGSNVEVLYCWHCGCKMDEVEK